MHNTHGTGIRLLKSIVNFMSVEFLCIAGFQREFKLINQFIFLCFTITEA